MLAATFSTGPAPLRPGTPARAGGLDIDPATRGPRVDSALRTSAPGVFAAGNLLHPVDTADIAALDGRHAAAEVRHWPAHPPHPTPASPWSPTRHCAGSPPDPAPRRPGPARHRLLAWTDAYVPVPHVQATQDGRVLTSRRLPWPAAPGRIFRIPSSLLTKAGALPQERTIHITLANSPRG